MLLFFENLSTGIHLVTNFDLIKCITKININSLPIYNGKVRGGLSPEKQNIGIKKIKSKEKLMICVV